MKVVVVGDGKVGGTIARLLSAEGNDVIVIDKNTKALNQAQNTMDIIAVEGNGASLSVLQKAGVRSADLVIAATSADEVNLLCCLFAKKLGADNTIARVRNPEYFFQMGMIKDELGLSMAVNPEMAAAHEISRLLRFPSALKIEPFCRGRVELVELKLPQDSILDGVPLYQLPKLLKVKVLVCAVQRGKEVFIPSGDFVLQGGDKINITGSHVETARFFKAIGMFRDSVKSVMILGGGRVAYYLAKELIPLKIRVKIIEMDRERCEYLCEELPEAVIINGDGTDKELLLEEGLEMTDALVALTGMDEENIVVSLYAKAKQVSKVIAKINKISFDEILDSLDIDSFIAPKTIAANNIVRFVRAMQNSYGSNVETLHRLINEQVEALEFIVRANSPVVGIPLKDLKTKKGLLIATIIRGGKIIIPGGEDAMEADDHVVVVTMEHTFYDLKDILK